MATIYSQAFAELKRGRGIRPHNADFVVSWLKSFWKGLRQPLRSEGQGCPESAAKFTPHAQQVLALSREEADRFRHNFVGTEHLLLGIVRLGQGTAVTVLEKLGLNLERLRAEIEKQVGCGPDQKISGNIPYTPRVKKVLALASKEADALKQKHIGTEHILLGLLREGDGVAGRVLKNFDVDLEKTRLQVLGELNDTANPTLQVADVAATLQPQHSSKEDLRAVDTSKRYDVYCSERNGQVIVYRNALFRERRKLLSTEKHDFGCEYLVLEQSNGHAVYLCLHSVLRFCEHGAAIAGEILPP
jgi:hypothetical protein